MTVAMTCRSCNARIVWATVEATGKRMPLDADPHPDGNVSLTPGMFCRVLTKDELEHEHAREDLGGRAARLHRSHFATCPNATKHRRA